MYQKQGHERGALNLVTRIGFNYICSVSRFECNLQSPPILYTNDVSCFIIDGKCVRRSILEMKNIINLAIHHRLGDKKFQRDGDVLDKTF